MTDEVKGAAKGLLDSIKGQIMSQPWPWLVGVLVIGLAAGLFLG